MHMHVSIPAKILLFGEYAVLNGSPAIAASLPHHRCDITLTLVPRRPRENQRITILSNYFIAGICQISVSLLRQPLWQPSALFSKTRFFEGLLRPVIDALPDDQHLKIAITRSFDRSLGFGSSSAIIAAIHLFFFRLQTGTTQVDASFWQGIRQALNNCQNGGSAYDIAVQLQDTQINPGRPRLPWNPKQPAQTAPHLYRFQWHKSPTPVLTKLTPPSKHMGVFIRSHVYAPTSTLLQSFRKQVRRRYYADAHGALSKQFLRHSQGYGTLMDASLKIAQSQGMTTPVDDLITSIRRHHISVKTTGAGGGDCLWLNCRPEALNALTHPVSGRPMSDEIVAELTWKSCHDS